MKVSLTYQQAIDATKVLLVLNKQKLPIRTSLAIARLSNLIDAELKTFTNARNALFGAYTISAQHVAEEGKDLTQFVTGVQGKNPEETRQKKIENLKAFNQKFNALLRSKMPEWDLEPIRLPPTVEDIQPKLLFPLAEIIEILPSADNAVVEA